MAKQIKTGISSTLDRLLKLNFTENEEELGPISKKVTPKKNKQYEPTPEEVEQERKDMVGMLK